MLQRFGNWLATPHLIARPLARAFFTGALGLAINSGALVVALYQQAPRSVLLFISAAVGGTLTHLVFYRNYYDTLRQNQQLWQRLAARGHAIDLLEDRVADLARQQAQKSIP